MNPYRWTGTLRRGTEPDTIVGILTDTFGFTIAITGTRTAEGYTLVGVPGSTPEAYSLPGDDDE